MSAKLSALFVFAFTLFIYGGNAAAESEESKRAMAQIRAYEIKDMEAKIKDFHLPKIPEQGKAIIYVIRPYGAGGLVRFNVFVDNKEPESEVGYTRGNEYIYFSIGPGRHKIYSLAEGWAEINLDVKAGDIIYIKQIVQMGLVMANNSLSLFEGPDIIEAKYRIKTSTLGTIIKNDVTQNQSPVAIVQSDTPPVSPISAEKAPLNTAQNPSITAPSNTQAVTATNEINTTNTKGIAEPVMIAIPGRDYEIGKFEVTRSQFAEFVNETNYDAGDKCITREDGISEDRSGRNWRNPGFTQDDNYPVVCVNWNDAQAYISWLSKRTGKQYRLPKEVEWEYACYGGSQTEYCGSNDINAVAWYVDNSSGQAHPVGQKQANGYGLYDMSGNVFEWTDDCSESGCPKRVTRGGTWFGKPPFVRAAFRLGLGTSTRVYGQGFRLARTIPVSSSPQPLKDAAAVTDTTNKTHTSSTKSDIQLTNGAISQKLRELHALKKEGLITEKEFQEKKKKLLEQY